MNNKFNEDITNYACYNPNPEFHEKDFVFGFCLICHVNCFKVFAVQFAAFDMTKMRRLIPY